MAKLKLSDASRRLRVPYGRLYQAVAAGLVPAERDGNGTRWLIDEQDLPQIARSLNATSLDKLENGTHRTAA